MSDIGSLAMNLVLSSVSETILVTAEATGRTAQQVVAFAQSMEQGILGIGPRLEEAHKTLMAEAQQATMAAYSSAREGGRHSPPYRTTARKAMNRRYAGGILASAISSPSFTEASPNGFSFGNIDLMDARARQWHRLNFGALSGAGQGHRLFSITWSNVSMALGMTAEGPSRAFTLPRGFWITPGGGRAPGGGTSDEFYPTSEAPAKMRRTQRPDERRQTRGILAENFLDAGVRSIATNLFPSYERVYAAIYEDAVAAGLRTVPGKVTKFVKPRPVSKTMVDTALRPYMRRVNKQLESVILWG